MSVWASIIGDFQAMLQSPAPAPVQRQAALPLEFVADSPAGIDLALWPAANFAPAELACRHCGRVKINTDALIKLQRLREAMERPLHINSAYRCPIHNANVGGAPLSQHKQGQAFDVSTYRWAEADRARLVAEAFKAGFTGFGGYNSFLHVDTARRRQWGQPWAWPRKE